jgi:hypothetical protein
MTALCTTPHTHTHTHIPCSYPPKGKKSTWRPATHTPTSTHIPHIPHIPHTPHNTSHTPHDHSHLFNATGTHKSSNRSLITLRAMQAAPLARCAFVQFQLVWWQHFVFLPWFSFHVRLRVEWWLQRFERRNNTDRVSHNFNCCFFLKETVFWPKELKIWKTPRVWSWQCANKFAFIKKKQNKISVFVNIISEKLGISQIGTYKRRESASPKHSVLNEFYLIKTHTARNYSIQSTILEFFNTSRTTQDTQHTAHTAHSIHHTAYTQHTSQHTSQSSQNTHRTSHKHMTHHRITHTRRDSLPNNHLVHFLKTLNGSKIFKNSLKDAQPAYESVDWWNVYRKNLSGLKSDFFSKFSVGNLKNKKSHLTLI